jgi:hypothetical protein
MVVKPPVALLSTARHLGSYRDELAASHDEHTAFLSCHDYAVTNPAYHAVDRQVMLLARAGVCHL